MQAPATSLQIEDGHLTEEPRIHISDSCSILYEVFRVDKGRPVFLQDHLQRLTLGLKKLNHTITVTQDELVRMIKELITKADIFNGNIRIELYLNPAQSETEHFRIFSIPSHYPTDQMLRDGVVCILMDQQRDNPNIKMARPDLRQKSESLIQKKNAYEAILHTKGLITEGSRSNLFFVTNNQLQTAPDNMVLPGIMRQKVLDLSKKHHIEVILRPMAIEDLTKADAVFITGTSPRILPVRQIDHIQFRVPDRLTTFLMTELQKMIN